MAQVLGCDFSALEPPTFASPGRHIRRGDQLHNEKKICYSDGCWCFELKLLEVIIGNK